MVQPVFSVSPKVVGLFLSEIAIIYGVAHITKIAVEVICRRNYYLTVAKWRTPISVVTTATLSFALVPYLNPLAALVALSLFSLVHMKPEIKIYWNPVFLRGKKVSFEERINSCLEWYRVDEFIRNTIIARRPTFIHALVKFLLSLEKFKDQNYRHEVLFYLQEEILEYIDCLIEPGKQFSLNKELFISQETMNKAKTAIQSCFNVGGETFKGFYNIIMDYVGDLEQETGKLIFRVAQRLEELQNHSNAEVRKIISANRYHFIKQPDFGKIDFSPLQRQLAPCFELKDKIPREIPVPQR